MSFILFGSSGFIGSAVFRKLIERGLGADVLLVKRDAPSDVGAETYGGIVVKWVNYDSLLSGRLDPWLKNNLTDISAVFDCAWPKISENYRHDLSNSLGVTHVQRVAEWCARQQRPLTAVFLGSCLEYSPSPHGSGPADSIVVSCLYTRAKQDARDALVGIAGRRSLSFVWARVFHVFGDGEPSFKLYSSIRRAGQCYEGKVCIQAPFSIRDFIHVNDAASQIIDAAKIRVTSRLNVCTGAPQTVFDFGVTVASGIRRNWWEFLEFNFSRGPSSLDILWGKQDVAKGLR